VVEKQEENDKKNYMCVKGKFQNKGKGRELIDK
jgi:hypothetical protein